jgi:hypothetical protein
MTKIPQGCYAYDSYLGECRSWHPPQWWEFVNVFSILAVGFGIVFLFTAVVLIADKAGVWGNDE